MFNLNSDLRPAPSSKSSNPIHSSKAYQHNQHQHQHQHPDHQQHHQQQQQPHHRQQQQQHHRQQQQQQSQHLHSHCPQHHQYNVSEVSHQSQWAEEGSTTESFIGSLHHLPESMPLTPDQGAQQITGLSLSSTMTRPITISTLHCPGEPRKRHKIATSCNRCRQNKRKCDGGVPCSTCKKLNVDCCYTDAQLSRALWGDSPLSREKVQGAVATRKHNVNNLKKRVSTGTDAESPSQPLALAQPSPQLSPQPTYSHLPATPTIKTSHLGHLDTANSGDICSLDCAAGADLTKSFRQSLDHVTGGQSRQITKAARVLQRVSPHAPPVAPLSPVVSIATGFGSPFDADPQYQPQTLQQVHQEEQGDDPASRTTLFQQTLWNDEGDALSPWQQLCLQQHLQQKRQQQQQQQQQQQHQQHQQQQQQQQQIFRNEDSSHFGPQPRRRDASSLLYGEPIDLLSEIEARDFGFVSAVASTDNADNNLGGDYFSGFHSLVPSTTTPTTTGTSTSSDVSISGKKDHAAILSKNDQYIPLDITQPWWSTAEMVTASCTATPASFTPSSLPTPFSSGPVSTRAITELQSPPEAEISDAEELRTKRIATDLLAIRRYDIAFRINRHIHDEEDEIWVPPAMVEPLYRNMDAPRVTKQPQGEASKQVPKHLQLIPVDADFLINVFFEQAHFYYPPVVNRAAVELAMMESDQAHALLLLNVVFMTASKHLFRAREFDRTIKFRERARELQNLVDDRRRLSVIQACLLGSLVTYGVFRKSPPFMATVLGVHDGRVAKGSLPFLGEQGSRSDSPSGGTFPEAAYQARLWCFWGLYIRNCVNRLYFGWPNALDNRAVTSELPRIEGCVGYGPKRSSRATLPSSSPILIGQRRDMAPRRDKDHYNKKRSYTDSRGDKRRPTHYRSNVASSDEEVERGGEERISRGETRGWGEDHLCTISKSDIQPRSWSSETSYPQLVFHKSDHHLYNHMEGRHAFPVLSRRILVKQSKREPGVYGDLLEQEMEAEESQTLEMEFHMDRLKLLMESEEDPTDNGTFARRLFLEEIRLWTIGRRVAIYLSDRADKRDLSFGGQTENIAFSCAPAQYRSQVYFDIDKQELHPAAKWSEQAWLQDKELQTLQSDLTEWERDLPDHLRFRSDVESEDVDHRINGKMSVLIMSYYTITIMLQSAYLPSLDKRASGTHPEVPVEGNSKDADTNSQKDNCHNSRSPTPTPTFSSDQAQGKRRKFVNSAHKICTELSNTALHHIELMLDSYPNWCSVQAKVNQALKVCMRVVCENSKPNMTCPAHREQAQVQFRMGSDLYRRLSVLPEPLTIRDHLVEKDAQYMVTATTMYDNESDEGGEELKCQGLEQSDWDHKSRVSELESAFNKMASPHHIFGTGKDETFDFEFPFPKVDRLSTK